MKRFQTPKEWAKSNQIAYRTVLDAVRTKQLPTIAIGKRLKIDMLALQPAQR